MQLSEYLDRMVDDVQWLIGQLDHHTDPCRECGLNHARVFGDYQASKLMQGIETRLRKTGEMITAGTLKDRALDMESDQ
jgi:hypothetical protein